MKIVKFLIGWVLFWAVLAYVATVKVPEMSFQEALVDSSVVLWTLGLGWLGGLSAMLFGSKDGDNNKLIAIVGLLLLPQMGNSQTQVFTNGEESWTLDSCYLNYYDNIRDIEVAYYLIPAVSKRLWDSNGITSLNTPEYEADYVPAYRITWKERFVAIDQYLNWSFVTIWFEKTSTSTSIIRIQYE